MQDGIQGSLHCATDDNAVHCFGRDDVPHSFISVRGQENPEPLHSETTLSRPEPRGSIARWGGETVSFFALFWAR